MNDDAHIHESFEQIRREHAELRELLGSVSRALADREISLEQASEMFTSLRGQIVKHFETEEQGQFFEEIIDHAPRLSDRANATCDEHEQLLAQVKQMADLALEKAGTPDWWQQLNDQFHDFSKGLMHHESQEMELMQEAYGEDIGSKD